MRPCARTSNTLQLSWHDESVVSTLPGITPCGTPLHWPVSSPSNTVHTFHSSELACDMYCGVQVIPGKQAAKSEFSRVDIYGPLGACHDWCSCCSSSQSKAGVCRQMHTVHELDVVSVAAGTSGLGSTLIPAHFEKAQARESDLQALSLSGLGSPEHRPDRFAMLAVGHASLAFVDFGSAITLAKDCPRRTDLRRCRSACDHIRAPMAAE